MKNRILLMGLTAALLANTVAVHADDAGADSDRGALRVAFGPSEIWSPSREQVQALHQCQSALFSCVQQVMDDADASSDAVAFYHLTGWFLADITEVDGPDGEAGPVQLGRIFNPWRANENEQLALLGGVPDVIYPEREGEGLSLDHDPDFAALKSAYPNALLWAPGPTLEDTAASPSDGQRFLLRYRVLDGCHACAILAYARVAFDFAPDGTFQGMHYQGLELT